MIGDVIHLVGSVRMNMSSCCGFYIDNKPSSPTDIIFVINDQKEVFPIDMSISGDARFSHKFAEKQNKYIDLKML